MEQNSKLSKNFESIMKVSQKGRQYWEARELMPHLGYKAWENFTKVIDKAKVSCENSGNVVHDHFRDVTKVILAGKGARQQIDDVLLDRYACYLVAQNGASTKQEIAEAQTYFANQTKKQEDTEQRLKEDKRLEERSRFTGVENQIRSTVYKRGVSRPVEFATFKNAHIKTLYAGKTTKELKKQKNIPEQRPLADFDTVIELAAKSLSLAMTDKNINEKDLRGVYYLQREVIANTAATRRALVERGIFPEKLKPEEDIKKIERRRQEEAKKLAELNRKKLL